MSKYTIAVVPGDGIGPEVCVATTQVLDAALGHRFQPDRLPDSRYGGASVRTICQRLISVRLVAGGLLFGLHLTVIGRAREGLSAQVVAEERAEMLEEMTRSLNEAGNDLGVEVIEVRVKKISASGLSTKRCSTTW